MSDEQKAQAAAAQERDRRVATVAVHWFKDAWSQALMAVNSAEEEAGKVLHKAGDLAGWGPDEVKRLSKEFGERLASQRKEFERSMEEVVAKTLSRTKIPSREQIESLQHRIERVGARIEALRAGQKRQEH